MAMLRGDKAKSGLIIGLACATGVLILITLSVGTAKLGVGDVLAVVLNQLPGVGPRLVPEVPAMHMVIVSTVRFPRIILSVLVGGALAAAGVVFQGVFQNPMAEPYVIGVSSGAALGASLAFLIGVQVRFLGLGTVPIFAFAGAILTTALVYSIARVGKRVPLTMLLLAGIAAGSFVSSINSLILLFSRDQTQQIIFWMMGGFAARNWDHVRAVLPYISIGYIAISLHARELNVLSLGEEKAQQIGVNIQRVQLLLVVCGVLITAAAVSVSGIIAFVGLIVPHVLRLLIGPDHRYLLPTSALAGGFFLLIADTLARTVISPVELPVGVITSFVGAPFFLFLLRRSRYNWR